MKQDRGLEIPGRRATKQRKEPRSVQLRRPLDRPLGGAFPRERAPVREGQRDEFMRVGRQLMREMSVPGFED